MKEELEACELLKRELKRREMIWQHEAKERLALKNGFPFDAYYDLTFDEWNAVWAASQPPPVATVERVVFRGEVLQRSYFQALAYVVEEERFVDALHLLYSQDSRRGLKNKALDLYALFCEIDWPEGYYYCMESQEEERRLYRDLLRRPQNGVRYRDGRWKSRGYTQQRLDEQAKVASSILSNANFNL